MTYLSGSGMGMVYQQGIPGFQQPMYSLEAAVQEYAPMYHIPVQSFTSPPLRFYGTQPEYKQTASSSSYTPSFVSISAPDMFSPEPFLKPDRPLARFVGETIEIAEHIEEAFAAVTGIPLPHNISIEVLPADAFRQMCEHFNGIWSEGVQGFSINNKGFGQSFVFVRQHSLDRVMVTVGHELGHIISFPLLKEHDEEAKAFAFEMAWIQALYDQDIAHLRDSLNLNPLMPAHNGLHDVAFAFVQNEMQKGKDGLLVFQQLVNHEVTLDHELLWQ